MEITCTNCKFKFKSVFFHATNSEITFKGNAESCPRCKTACNTPNGKYHFDKTGKATLIQKLKDINLSKSEIDNIQLFAEKAKNNEITIEEFELELNNITPKLKGIIPENIHTRKAFSEFLMILLALLLVLKTNLDQQPNTTKLDKNRIKTEKKANINRAKTESDSLLIEARRAQLKAARAYRIK